MRVRLAGVGLDVEPLSRLSEDELGALARLDGAGSDGALPSAAFRLRLVDQPLFADGVDASSTSGRPAQIVADDPLIHIHHAAFQAEIDTTAWTGQLYRSTTAAYALEITLRVALCARLPFAGGLPLHAAGVVLDGSGVVFFGPSGAGKSTLAATASCPVLSDELVAVLASPARLRASGFWGELDQGPATSHQHPLRALVELGRGPDLHLERLDRRTALRRLLQVVLVPQLPGLWQPAMAVLSALVDEVPVLRMEWSPQQPPWRELQHALALEPRDQAPDRWPAALAGRCTAHRIGGPR